MIAGIGQVHGKTYFLIGNQFGQAANGKPGYGIARPGIIQAKTPQRCAAPAKNLSGRGISSFPFREILAPRQIVPSGQNTSE